MTASSKVSSHQRLEVLAAAPDKPLLGTACNGCGVCCSAEPCPIGQLVFLQRTGACPALLWQAEQSRYACGLALEPVRFFGASHLRWLPMSRWPGLAPWLRKVVLKRISAGSGCDSNVVLVK